MDMADVQAGPKDFEELRRIYGVSPDDLRSMTKEDKEALVKQITRQSSDVAVYILADFDANRKVSAIRFGNARSKKRVETLASAWNPRSPEVVYLAFCENGDDAERLYFTTRAAAAALGEALPTNPSWHGLEIAIAIQLLTNQAMMHQIRIRGAEEREMQIARNVILAWKEQQRKNSTAS